MPYSRHKVMLGLEGVASSSTGTSNPIFVGDCRLLTISRQTSSASASNLTISLSNDEGFATAPTNWSNVTILPNRGIFTIDPGARWIRAERANFQMTSVASNETVILNRYYE